MNDLLTVALSDEQESETVEFKERLETKSKSAWYEILKDMVALANSGGGVILVGLKNDGHASGHDVSEILSYDPADITNKVFANTGRHFGDFKITKCEKDGCPIAALEVGRVSVPLIFTTSGNYVGEDGKQKSAFSVGVVYFRHGAKSEPATSDDLQNFIARELNVVRESWLSGIRKVVEAPEGSKVMILPPDSFVAKGDELPRMRIVDDPKAPAITLREEDFLRTYPLDYGKLTKKLASRYSDFIINKQYHDIRRSLESNPRFCHKRLLNPESPRTGYKRFYSPHIVDEFDRYYTQ